MAKSELSCSVSANWAAGRTSRVSRTCSISAARVSLTRPRGRTRCRLASASSAARERQDEELLGPHVREVGVGADRVAGDAGGKPAALAIGEAAVQHGLKNLDRRRVDERRVGGQLAALGDHADDRLDRGVFVGADGDVVRRQSEDEKPDERLAGQPLASERLDERLGAHLADHLAALLGDVGTRPGLSGRSIVAAPAPVFDAFAAGAGGVK